MVSGKSHKLLPLGLVGSSPIPATGVCLSRLFRNGGMVDTARYEISSQIITRNGLLEVRVLLPKRVTSSNGSQASSQGF